MTRRSLSPECTPLKHRYDSCFNAWFEGYLQPALDASSSAAIGDSPRLQHARSVGDSVRESHQAMPDQTGGVERPVPLQGSPVEDTVHRNPTIARPKTNWSGAIGRSSVSRHNSASSVADTSAPLSLGNHESNQVDLPQIDTRGKTRAQIKAEQYERACGEQWKAYRHCIEVRGPYALGDIKQNSSFKRGIAQNQSLSALLNQAREEHPLVSEKGLEGTPWDPNRTPDE